MLSERGYMFDLSQVARKPPKILSTKRANVHIFSINLDDVDRRIKDGMVRRYQVRILHRLVNSFELRFTSGGDSVVAKGWIMEPRVSRV